MTLNDKQRQLVNDNIGLVGKVIKDKIHNPNQLGIYTYDVSSDRLYRVV